jgi:hypothetical protein
VSSSKALFVDFREGGGKTLEYLLEYVAGQGVSRSTGWYDNKKQMHEAKRWKII